jgi:hypothetical protein
MSTFTMNAFTLNVNRLTHSLARMRGQFLDSMEAGQNAKAIGDEHAGVAMAGLTPPAGELEALAFWTHLAELIDAEIPEALAAAGEAHTWSAVGGALGTSPQSASQRHRRYQARAAGG